MPQDKLAALEFKPDRTQQRLQRREAVAVTG
jgi:hypothetical protein